MTKVRPVILCGGAGTRLWPASRSSLPKQFAALRGNLSTFQDTLLRIKDPRLFGRPLVVTSGEHRHLAERQLSEIDVDAEIVLEPERRDSGPAILAACCLVERESEKALALILAADHIVRMPAAFLEAIAQGQEAASAGRLVTFGITPTRAETEYGYIEPGEPVEGGARKVRRFAEKPNAETACQYVADGYLWNSGNFLFDPASLIAEYRRFAPEAASAVESAVAASERRHSAILLPKHDFSRAEKRSIDYAVFELTDRAAVVRTSCGWSDVGTWASMWQVEDHDLSGNSIHGDVEPVDTHNCFVTTDRTLISLLGVQDLVVIANRDAILVADRNRTAEVKGVVESLRAKGRSEADSHMRNHRPWGWYEVIEAGERFQVKKIVVYPGGRLSLQKHRQRAEHWVVVNGVAKVTIDDKIKTIGANEHVYIPLGAVHRLENPGNDALLELIEVQSGEYLGEDDIIRLEDDYHRA